MRNNLRLHTQDHTWILNCVGFIMYVGCVMRVFVWCHGPYCHTLSTVDRVRGSKGSKVLRTRKVKQHNDNGYTYDINSIYNYFCSMHCYNEFANKYAEQIINSTETRATRNTYRRPQKRKLKYHWGLIHKNCNKKA